MSNQNDKVVELYEKLIERRPHYIRAKTSLADFYRRSGRNKDAMKIYEDLMKSNPNLYRSISWQIRNLYQSMGQGEKLAEMEQEMVEKAKNPDQMRQLAHDFKNQREYEKALELMKKAYEMRPDQTYYASELADIQMQLGRYDEALETYKQACESPTSRMTSRVDVNMVGKMVGLYRAMGRLDELKKKNEEDLNDSPNDDFAKTVQVQIAKHEKDFDKAVELYVDLAKTQSNNHNLVNDLVELAEITGNATPILEMIESKGMLNNYFDNGRIAQLYIATGQPDKAMKSWDQMVARYGGSYGYLEVFRQMMQMNLVEQAEEFYKKNRKKIGNEEYILREMDGQMARRYATSGEFGEFVEGIYEKESLGNDDVQMVKNIVNYIQRNGMDTAIEFLEPLVVKHPDEKEILELMATSLTSANRHDEALPLYEKLVDLDEDNAGNHRRYANVLRELDRADEAVERIRNWAEAKPSKERYEVLADTLHGAGRYRELRELGEKVLEDGGRFREGRGRTLPGAGRKAISEIGVF